MLLQTLKSTEAVGAFISGTLGSDLVVEDCIFQNGVAGVGGAISLESIISNIFH